MIVISGVLVLVALVLLVIGVVQEALPFVYASIGVSLVSLVFLLLGILQRRKEPLPDAAGSGGPAPAQADHPPVDVSDGVTAVVPAQTTAPTSTRVGEEPAVAASVQDEPTVGGTVLVVSGRPRYHVEGCRYLTGKQAEEVDVLDARDEGFTPCGVCRPDDALAAAPAGDDTTATTSVQPLPTSEDLAAAQSYDDEPVAEEPVAVPVEEPERPSRRAAARKASSAAAAKAPAARKRAATAETSAVPAPAAKAAAKAPAKRAAAKTAAPSRAAAAAAEGTPAAATARRAGGVVVIPERGRFHKAECRYVRGVDGAEVLTKAQASKQGYEACGVCKP